MSGSATIDTTGETSNPLGSLSSFPDSLIAESNEQQNQVPDQNQHLDDSTKQKSPDTTDSSDSPQPPPSSTPPFEFTRVDFKTPADE
ncbi:hypothetical protein MMC29_004025 [Sticta canariensis]|nr:hypothetical protein [Sticta canariensis]